MRFLPWFVEAGLLVVLPLLFYRGFTEQFSTAKILLTKVLIVLGLAAWALGIVWDKLVWPANFRLWPPLAFLVLVVLISCTRSPLTFYSLHESQYFLCGPAWVLLLMSWTRGEATIRRVSTLAACAGTVVAAIAVSQWLGHDPLLAEGYQVEWGTMVSRMRLYSTLGNPNFVAGYLIGAVFLALALAAAVPRGWSRLAWYASAVLMLAAIVGAGSRGAALGLVAGLLMAGFAWKRGGSDARKSGKPLRERDKSVGVAPILTLLVLPTVWAMVLPVGTLTSRLFSQLEGRLYLWRVAWTMFAEHPWLGSGWGTFQLRFLDSQARFLAEHPEMVRYWSNIRQLHNDPLQLLVEAGLAGFVACGWVMWTYSRQVRAGLHSSSARSPRLWLSASVGGVTAILVDSLFNFQLAVPPTFLLLFTLLALPALLQVDSGSERAPQRSPRADPGTKPSANSPSRNQLPSRWGWRSFRAAVSLAVLVSAAILLRQVFRRAAAERDYATGHRHEAIEELAPAEESYRHGLALDPDNGRLHYGLARVLYLTGKFPDALREASLAEQTYRDSHLEVLKARIQDQMGLGPQALETYRHALALDPTLKTVQADIERLQRR